MSRRATMHDMRCLVEFFKTLYRFEVIGERSMGEIFDIYYHYTRSSIDLMHDCELLEKNLQSWNI